MSSNRRARQLLPVVTALAFVALLAFSTFYAKPEAGSAAAEGHSISGIVNSVSVDDLGPIL
jgi:hypothetical protein